MDLATREVLSLARSVVEELDLEVVLQRVLESARTLTGARYAALGVLDESQSTLARFLDGGVDDETRRLIGPLPTGHGVLGELIRDPVPLRLDDLSAHPHSYGFPIAHPMMRTFLGVPIFVSGLAFGNLYLAEKQDEAAFTEEDEEVTVMLAELAAVAIGHARRYGDAEDTRGVQARRLRALDATLQISRALAGETDLDSIFELVAKRGRALVGARSVVIELLSADELEVRACAGEVAAQLMGWRMPLRDTVASVALRTRRSQTIEEDMNRARFEQHGLGRMLKADDALIVPLLFRDRAFGALVALDQLASGEFTAEHQRLLESFAVSAAAAVATAHSFADERRLERLQAAEAERGRWARELHDGPLQRMTRLHSVLARVERDPGEAEVTAAIAEAIAQVQADMSELRSLITDLRPAALDELGLEPAVRALVDRVMSQGIDVEAVVDLACEQKREAERLTSDSETALYRIAQEALLNAAKHAQPTRVLLRLIENEQAVSLTVQDDGAGFDPAVDASGLGLLGMRERCELLGGRLVIDSTPGAGTTVSAVLPASHRALSVFPDRSPPTPT